MKLKPTLATMLAFTILGTASATANGTQPDAQQPASPPQTAPGAPMTPVWVQLPAAGSYPYYLVTPQSVPAYPLPQMTLPPGWGPFVMVWVPVQALQSASPPPVVDYGPVTDTPVVVLPEPEPAPVAEVPSELPPAAATSAGPIPDVALPTVVPAGGAAVPVEPGTAAGSNLAPAPDVDYGPITPTPVIELPDFTAPPAAAAPVQAPVKARKKPVSSKKLVKPAKTAPAAAAPTRKRMCWSNGVVAPCR